MHTHSNFVAGLSTLPPVQIQLEDRIQHWTVPCQHSEMLGVEEPAIRRLLERERPL